MFTWIVYLKSVPQNKPKYHDMIQFLLFNFNLKELITTHLELKEMATTQAWQKQTNLILISK